MTPDTVLEYLCSRLWEYMGQRAFNRSNDQAKDQTKGQTKSQAKDRIDPDRLCELLISYVETAENELVIVVDSPVS